MLGFIKRDKVLQFPLLFKGCIHGNTSVINIAIIWPTDKYEKLKDIYVIVLLNIQIKFYQKPFCTVVKMCIKKNKQTIN